LGKIFIKICAKFLLTKMLGVWYNGKPGWASAAGPTKKKPSKRGFPKEGLYILG
jgi:hypothetical protein